MAVMHWDPKMSVGLDVLDDDHKQLISIINRLGEDYQDEARHAAVQQLLRALQRYAEYHFAREEKVMLACGYPEIEEHQDEHRGFIAKIRELTRRFESNPETSADIVNEQLLSFLKGWLNHHIMIEDKAYFSHVANNPAAKQAAKSFQATQIWWTG